MVNLIDKEATRAKTLFVGDLTPGREAMLGGLRDIGMEALHFETPYKARSRMNWCDFILYGATDPADMASIRRIGETGKPFAAVLRPEDKGFTPLSIQSGARTVFVDEVHPDEVFQFSRGLSEEGFLRRELRWLRTEAREEHGGWRFVGTSAAAERLRRSIQLAGQKYRSILMEGEKGLNFQLVARALHSQYPGGRNPFLHWGPKMRRASTLEKAIKRMEEKRGEEGDILEKGGTLFIEDAQLIGRDQQKALANVLRKKSLSQEFRVIFGCTHDPEKLIQDKILKRLYHEETTCIIKIPPLRDRKKDISLVAQGILDEFSRRVGRPKRRITPAAIEWFSGQKWWGNEAELEMSVCRAFLVSAGDSISLDDLSPFPRRRRAGDIESFFRERLSSVVTALGDGEDSDFYQHTIRSVEKPLLELVLREAGGNQVQAARLLGMNRNTLRRKLQEFGLTKTTASTRRR